MSMLDVVPGVAQAKLIIVGIVVAIILSTGFWIKHQTNVIKDLQDDKVLFTAKNKELADKINDQNDRLREGEIKYNKAQSDLDVASGKNQSLAASYAKLRAEWNNRPLPKTCDESMIELRLWFSDNAKKWNNKE